MAGVVFNTYPARPASDDDDLVILWDDSEAAVKTEAQSDFRDALAPGAVSTVLTADLTASRALVSNGSGKIAASDVTDTEVGYLDGVDQNLDRSPVVNRLINSNFDVWDLGTGFATPGDVTWLLPNWVWLYDTTGTVFSLLSRDDASPPARSRYVLDVSAGAGAGTRVGGIFQVLRAADTIPLRDQVVSLRVMGYGTSSQTICLGLYAWTGTADSPTIDFVSSWATDLPPATLATNWTAISETTSPLSASWVEYALENITLGSSVNNLGIFIGIKQPASVFGQIGQPQLQIGKVATDFVPRTIQAERNLIALGNYEATAAPGVNDDVSKGYGLGSDWIDVSANDAYICVDPTAGAAVWKQTTP